MPASHSWFKSSARRRPFASLVSFTLRALLLAVCAAPLAIQLAPLTIAQARPADTFLLYLPLVQMQRPGISGQVRLSGAPIGGVSLNLRFYNGSAMSTIAVTSTGADGVYSFTGAPSLGPGQYYEVQFNNQSLSQHVAGRLAAWITRALTTYTAGSDVGIGDFDVAAVAMLTPVDGATVALPATFTWTPRAATPSDGYQYLLYDISGSVNFLSPLLGHADHYQLNTLPPGFSLGHAYAWVVVVNGPDGGIGSSAPYFHVTFSSSARATGP